METSELLKSSENNSNKSYFYDAISTSSVEGGSFYSLMMLKKICFQFE